ncbi:hypothetical protein GQ457_07G012700 [Hibiscus cannabinus]
MKLEFDALMNNNTWELVPSSSSQNIVDCKWLFRLKTKPDGTVDQYKARLIARGFTQRPGVDYHSTFSPVINPVTARLILSLVVQYNWSLHQLDVSYTFLQCHLAETVYMRQPQGYEHHDYPSYVCEYRYPKSSIDTLSCRSAFNASRKLLNGSIDDLTYQNGWKPVRGYKNKLLKLQQQQENHPRSKIKFNATWKIVVLEALFDMKRVKRICSIPLSKVELCDASIWRPDGSGDYSMKSGYQLLRDDLLSLTGLNSHSLSTIFSKFYSEMCDVNIPSKIKINMWRIANNFLPTFENLQSRRLNVINTFPFCLSSSESVEHVMRDCSFIHQFFDRQCVQILSADSAFIRENETLTSPSFQRVISHRVGWTTPVENEIKCNFDSAYVALSRESSSGVICCDSARFIMVSAIIPHRHVADVFVAEAFSCLQAVIFAKDLRFAKVVIEGDSLTVIKKVCATTSDSSLLGPIIHAIKEVSKGFESVVFCFVHREANNIAHTLAREGKGQCSLMFWIEVAPTDIDGISLVLKECYEPLLEISRSVELLCLLVIWSLKMYFSFHFYKA